MSLPADFLKWMKDSLTAMQDQIKQQAEDQKAAEQRHQDALRAMEKRAIKADEAAKKEREEMQEAMEKNNEAF